MDFKEEPGLPGPEKFIRADAGHKLQKLINNLIKGNRKKALKLARKSLQASDSKSEACRHLIEELARQQAAKNALVNSPSIFPGLGTLISLGLLGFEDFLVLDQCITLSLGLHALNGTPLDDYDQIQPQITTAIGRALELNMPDAQAVNEELAGHAMPQRYLNKGLNKAINRVTGRFFRQGRIGRLLPVGFGVAMSAYHGQKLVRKVGRITLTMIEAK